MIVDQKTREGVWQMTTVAALNAGQQTAFPTLNRVETSRQVTADITKSNFSKVLGAGSDGTQSKVDEVVENKLTGMLLGNFVQLMLPKETEGLFGERRFADMWNSMLANSLADSMSASGKIDLRFGNH